MFPSFEALESRVLFAGDALEAAADAAAGVTASIRKGAPVVRGDAAGNDLSLTPDPSGGLKLDGGGSTTINDQPTAVFAGVSRGIRIGLGDGDDRLTVSGLIPPGNLSVDTGRGADEVSFQPAGVQGSLRIFRDSGTNTVELTSSAVGGRTVVATGLHDDSVTLADPTFGGRVTIRTGRGNDSVREESIFKGGIRVKDGSGRDAVSITGGF